MMGDIEINDAWEWVKARSGQDISLLGKRVCHVLTRMGHGGIYNRPVAWERQDWTNEHCITVQWGGDLANWDGYGLTALWAWCAELMLRVEIRPSGPRTLKLMFWHRSSRDGGMGERLPTADGQLEWVGLPRLANQAKRIKELEEALEWYANKARDCRKLTANGDNARHAINDDGGAKARAALKQEGADHG